MQLHDKHVLITGGSAGIGLALARALIDAGARVTICGRSAPRLERACSLLGPSAHAVPCDLADLDQHQRLLDAAVCTHGPLDVLVNNAGSQQLMDFRREGQERPIAEELLLNLTAPVRLTEAALPMLRRRPEAAVVQITSGLALSPKASAPVYCAAKAGLRSFTRALRWQLSGGGVRVVEVLPPLVDTAMTAGRGRGKISPEAAAAEIFVGKAKLLRLITRLAPRLGERITRRW